MEQMIVTHKVFVQSGICELGGLQLSVVFLCKGKTLRVLFEQGVERLSGCDIGLLGFILCRGRNRDGREAGGARSDDKDKECQAFLQFLNS
jgi:hypothetical protein